jgi:hypothetical protein
MADGSSAARTEPSRQELDMKRFLTALILCHAAGFALAQSAAATATATASGSATAKAAAFRCGGIGDEDQKRIKAEAGQHDMLLTFATTGGAYLADIDVEISSGDKLVLRARCGGPLMLVDVGAKGSYQVRAVSNGREQRKSVTLGAKPPASLSFIWPAS